MEEYYEVVRIREHIYHIYEPGNVGSVLVIGKTKAMLIDTGFGFADLKAVVDTLTDLPLEVVNTHGHTDHTGANNQFEKVWINQADMEAYEDYQKNQKPLVAARFEAVQKASGKPDIWPESFDRMQWYESGTNEFVFLEDGQIFDLSEHTEEKYAIETIFLPGHTAGSTVFFDWQTHLLYAGDDLDYSLWLMFNNSVSLSVYRENLKRLNNYPIEGVLPAHRREVISPSILDWMLTALNHVCLEDSRRFFHPRTGIPAMLYKEQLNNEYPDGIHTIYIVYKENEM